MQLHTFIPRQGWGVEMGNTGILAVYLHKCMLKIVLKRHFKGTLKKIFLEFFLQKAFYSKNNVLIVGLIVFLKV